MLFFFSFKLKIRISLLLINLFFFIFAFEKKDIESIFFFLKFAKFFYQYLFKHIESIVIFPFNANE